MAASNTLRVGDYGIAVSATIVEDVSVVPATVHDLTNYTTISFVFTSPSGTKSTKTGASASPTTGVCTYTIESGLLAEAGTWRMEVILSKTGASLTTRQAKFTVEAAL